MRRLHQEIKEVFDDYNQSQEIKSKLLTGRRVTLVEELSKYLNLYIFKNFNLVTLQKSILVITRAYIHPFSKISDKLKLFQ